MRLPNSIFLVRQDRTGLERGAINGSVIAIEPDIISAAGATGFSQKKLSPVQNGNGWKDQDRAASGSGTGSCFVTMTNQAALSTILFVINFFLVLNLLLFAGIYRRNRSCSTRRANKTPSELKHEWVTESYIGQDKGLSPSSITYILGTSITIRRLFFFYYTINDYFSLIN